MSEFEKITIYLIWFTYSIVLLIRVNRQGRKLQSKIKCDMHMMQNTINEQREIIRMLNENKHRAHITISKLHKGYLTLRNYFKEGISFSEGKGKTKDGTIIEIVDLDKDMELFPEIRSDNPQNN